MQQQSGPSENGKELKPRLTENRQEPGVVAFYDIQPGNGAALFYKAPIVPEPTWGSSFRKKWKNLARRSP